MCEITASYLKAACQGYFRALGVAESHFDSDILSGKFQRTINLATDFLRNSFKTETPSPFKKVAAVAFAGVCTLELPTVGMAIDNYTKSRGLRDLRKFGQPRLHLALWAIDLSLCLLENAHIGSIPHEDGRPRVLTTPVELSWHFNADLAHFIAKAANSFVENRDFRRISVSIESLALALEAQAYAANPETAYEQHEDDGETSYPI